VRKNFYFSCKKTINPVAQTGGFSHTVSGSYQADSQNKYPHTLA